MNAIRKEPWSLFDQLQNDINHLFDARGSARDVSTSAVSDWSPPVDIVEYPDKFVLLVDVPGVPVAEMEISLEHGVLCVKGARKPPATGDDGNLRRAERARGTFFRRFVLPDTASAEDVSASGRDGVLEIVIPKAQPAKPRKINVRIE